MTTGRDLLETLRGLTDPNGIRLSAAAPGGAAPLITLRPRSTEDVSAMLDACNRHRQPVAVIGGGTGFNGGNQVQPGEIGLSLERMSRVSRVDTVAGTVVAEAGAILQSVQQAADDAGYRLGLDLGARGSCTIGGNIATNAGGSRVIRYGMCRAQVLGLEAVLADGTIVSSMRGLAKDNAGYDLKQLFIGSEGTLGVVTKACLRLHERPASGLAVLVALPDLASALELLRVVGAALGTGLSAFEIIWGDVYDGVIAAGLHGEGSVPLPAGSPLYALIDCQWTRGADLSEAVEATLTESIGRGIALDAVLSRSEAEYARLWRVREGCAELILGKTDCYGFDVGIPLAHMETFVSAARAELARQEPNARVHVFGHLGDGNLHFIVETKTPAKASDIVYAQVATAGGTIAAEHGIGLEKKPYLQLCRSDAEIALMRLLKRTLDPNNILNPGRVIDIAPAAEDHAGASTRHAGTA